MLIVKNGADNQTPFSRAIYFFSLFILFYVFESVRVCFSLQQTKLDLLSGVILFVDKFAILRY